MIRRATPQDIPHLMAFAETFCTSIPDFDVPFCEKSAFITMNELITGDGAEIFMTDKGMLGASLQPLLFNHDYVQAIEHFWYGDVRLFKHYAGWGDLHAHRTIIGSIHNRAHERLDKFYRKMGFAPVEHFYAKEAS